MLTRCALFVSGRRQWRQLETTRPGPEIIIDVIIITVVVVLYSRFIRIMSCDWQRTRHAIENVHDGRVYKTNGGRRSNADDRRRKIREIYNGK